MFFCCAVVCFGQIKKPAHGIGGLPILSTDSLTTHTAGPGHGTLGFRIEDQTKWKGHAYRITMIDDGAIEPTVTIFDLAENIARATNILLDSVLSPTFPTIDGFRVLQGSMALPYKDSLGNHAVYSDFTYTPPANDWISYNTVWESGESWGWGTTLSLYYDCVPIRLVFSDSNAQHAYVYLRGGTPSYGYAGWGQVPFKVYDMSDSANPRQLNVAFMENNKFPHQDMKWLPYDASNDREYLFILKSTYTGTEDAFYTSKNIRNDAADMDIMYSCWAYKNPSATGFYHPGDVISVSQTVPISYRDTFYVNINGERMNLTNAARITSSAVTNARAQIAYSYTVTATGTPAPVFSLITKPTGMTIDSVSGVIAWTPSDTQVGNNNVKVRATNSVGYDEQVFTIDVQPPFTAPKITCKVDSVAYARTAFSYQVTASGLPAPHFKLTTKPTGMTIDSLTGIISWTPTDAQVGKQYGTVRATNNSGYDQLAFSIIVQPATTPPTITSKADTIIVAQTAYYYQITASGRPAPSFHLTMYPSGMTIDTTSGKVTWMSQRSQFGPHSVTITATNSSGSDAQSFTVTVFTKPELPFISNQNVHSDSAFQYTAVADAYPAATYSFDASPTGMTIGASSGVINWTPTKAQAGAHSVQVRATNLYGNAQRDFTITVDSAALAVTRLQQPLWFSIGQSYPNPLVISQNERLVIPLEIKKPLVLSVRIFSIDGKLRRTFTKDMMTGGSQEMKIDLHELPVGNYYYSVSDPEGGVQTKGFVLVK